jgi:arylsulfatase A-like enzyme
MNKPNILLAVLDAVRPDHLSCYGYSRETTPNIDEIAKDGVLFENAFSAAPWTPPSHASLFTGMYPSQHGVLGKNLYLSKKVQTIAEILRAEGYETLGICINPWVGFHTGLHRGFKKFISTLHRRYLDRFSSRLSLDSIIFCLKTDIRGITYGWTYQVRLFQKMKEWIINSQKKNKPFLIFVNYLDAHTPYNPPEPFKSKFERFHNRNADLQKIKDIFNTRHGYPYVAKECEVSEDEWDILKSWYDGEIAYIDFFLGKLFDYLKEREIYDNTFFIITSDHGENFGEHELANHVFCLYDTLLHIPLIMRYSKYFSGGKRISNIVSNIDIFPTLLSVLNVKIKVKHRINGVNLIPLENRIYHRYICAEYGPPFADIKALERFNPHMLLPSLRNKYNRSLKCIRSDDFKYIIASDGEEELYNLKKDPEENKNIIKELPEKAEELKSILIKELKGYPLKKTMPAFEDKMKKRLQELGYF